MEFLTPSALAEVRPSYKDVEIKEGNLRVRRLPIDEMIPFITEFSSMPDEIQGDDVDQGAYLKFIIPILSKTLDGDWDNKEGHDLLATLSPTSINELQSVAFELNGLDNFGAEINDAKGEAKNE